MYLAYYGLAKEPFHITPDPEFLYYSPSHKEALASIIFGIEQGKGFVAVTGEVGTGKTTILRSYLNHAKERGIHPICTFDPFMTFDELLRFLLIELGADIEDGSPAWMSAQLQVALIEEFRQGRNVVLLIDEAQNMPVETLERLRTLSNLETTKEKLLQIVLVGQPELDDKLNLHALRQLKQRIAVRATIRPLTASESKEYIQHRLRMASGGGGAIFEPAALRKIVRHAKGIPRTLNIVCANALVAGYGAQTKPVRKRLVREVIRDLERPSRMRSIRWAVISAAFMVLCLGISLGISGFVFGAPRGSANVIPHPVQTALNTDALEVEPPYVVALPWEVSESPEPSAPQPWLDSSGPTDLGPAGNATSGSGGAVTMVLKEGDCLSDLMTAVYGESGPDLVRLVMERNPHIADENIIPTGEILVFPALVASKRQVDSESGS